jgi:5-formyltetrahydrofolate cyclo-ligase
MGSPPAQAGKAELRRQFRARRRQLLMAAEPLLQARAGLELPPLLRGGGCLGIYWPLPGEVDLRGLAESPHLHQRLALPRVCDGTMRYLRWRPGDPLQADATGIPAPATGDPLPPGQLAVLLAPALAFDRSGYRLGYGGGWFDRLRSQPDWDRVTALAVLPAGCLVQNLPADPWDVPFAGWLDETGLHWLQAV